MHVIRIWFTNLITTVRKMLKLCGCDFCFVKWIKYTWTIWVIGNNNGNGNNTKYRTAWLMSHIECQNTANWTILSLKKRNTFYVICCTQCRTDSRAFMCSPFVFIHLGSNELETWTAFDWTGDSCQEAWKVHEWADRKIDKIKWISHSNWSENVLTPTEIIWANAFVL